MPRAAITRGRDSTRVGNRLEGHRSGCFVPDKTVDGGVSRGVPFACVSRSRLPLFVLEGSNSFATAYYVNFLMFLLREDYGFSNLNNLVVGAVHGFVYGIASWQAGRIGQRHGLFPSLRIGFGGMSIALAVGWSLPTQWGQLLCLGIWTVALCFTWPILEALVSEHEDPKRLPDRVGLYNVVWATMAAVGLSTGGWIFERLGPTSLYWLPLGIHGIQWVATWPLERQRARWIASLPQARGQDRQGDHRYQPGYFVRLAWIANPFNYMAINTILVMAPGIASRLGLSIAEAGLVLSAWFYVRALAFLKLWWWSGWHYRFDWFLCGFLFLFLGFVGTMVAPTVWGLVVSQVGFGWASALLYYSSLYYSMDQTKSHAEQGGFHEALIGLGLGGGPAISAGALWWTGVPSSPAWIVGAGVLGAMGWVFGIRRAALRPRAGSPSSGR
ncbi:MAG: MFS transporter [Verrucomicrobia bacterium]|nr:MFS transporter [Verrucomicrobiota bacterium]